MIFAIVYGVLAAVGIPLMILLRNREPIKSREWPLMVVHVLMVTVEIALRAADQETIPCAVNFVRFTVFEPLFLAPYFLRSFKLWYSFSLQKSLFMADQTGFRAKFLVFLKARPWLVSFRTQLLVLLFLFIVFGAIGLGVGFTTPPVSQTLYCIGSTSLSVSFYITIVLVIAAVAVIWFLWGVRDVYMIRLELLLLLIYGVTMDIIWGTASIRDWQPPIGSYLWLDLCELGFQLVSIYLPVLGTIYYHRLLRGTNLKEEMSGDELTIVLIHPKLAPSFERSVTPAGEHAPSLRSS